MTPLSGTTIYCVECGTAIEGRFCWRCGAEAHADGAAREPRISYARVAAVRTASLAERLRAALAGVPIPERRTLAAAAAAVLIGICCLAFPPLAIVIALGTFAVLAIGAAREAQS